MTQESDPAAARLRALLESGASRDSALALFDTLPPLPLDALIGSWRGSGLPTGHPLDGLLEHYGWWGKRFAGPEEARPLVFLHRNRLIEINPVFMPMALMQRRPTLLRTRFARRLFRLVAPLLTTRAPKARLRMTEHRGLSTATMIYDALPINDVFRKVDDDTLLGLMDMRGMAAPFFFVLRRQSGAQEL